MEKLSTQLENETLQNQDRRKKIRVYVDKLQGDKTRLEEQVAGKVAELTAVSREKELLLERITDLTSKHKGEHNQVCCQRSPVVTSHSKSVRY